MSLGERAVSWLCSLRSTTARPSVRCAGGAVPLLRHPRPKLVVGYFLGASFVLTLLTLSALDFPAGASSTLSSAAAAPMNGPSSSQPGVAVRAGSRAVALPELSEPSVTGSPGVAGAPFVGYPGSAFIYRVRYRHPDNVPPAYVRVRILNPSATHYSELRVLMLTREPGQSGSEADPGIFYSNAVKDAVSEGPFAGFGAPGTYHYYFEASDGQRVTTLDFGGRPFDGPVVAAPALSPLGVTPVRGVRAEPFTFQVRYAHPAGVRSASVRLRLIGPKGDPIPLANNGAMDPPEAPVDAELVSPGWVFTSKPICSRRLAPTATRSLPATATPRWRRPCLPRRGRWRCRWSRRCSAAPRRCPQRGCRIR